VRELVDLEDFSGPGGSVQPWHRGGVNKSDRIYRARAKGGSPSTFLDIRREEKIVGAEPGLSLYSR
jgi:hypothetical protein